MARKKTPPCDAVLMLIREKPGRTRSEIAKEAASLRCIFSLLFEKPSAALSLLGEHGDRTKSPETGAEHSVNAADNDGYVEEGSDGTFRITAAGREWLRTNSGL